MRLKLLIALAFILTAVNSIPAQTDKREAFGIFIDTTASLRTQLEREIEVAKEVVKQVNNGSSFSLFRFATDPNPRSPYARYAAGPQCVIEKDSITNQIDNLFIVQGQTTLWDAVKLSSNSLNSGKPVTCGEFSNRNLVLITDGEDRASTVKLTDLVSALKANGTRVYIVGLLDGLLDEKSFLGTTPRRKSREFLEKLAAETGGKVVFPDKKQSAEEIVRDLLGTAPKPFK